MTAPAASTRPARRVEGLLGLQPTVLWREWNRQSVAFFALCFYLFIEYVRPQQVWPVIDVLPWGKAALIICILATLMEGTPKRKALTLDWMLGLYTVILVASIPLGYDSGRGFSELFVYVNWLLLYWLSTRILITPQQYFLFFLTFVLWSLKMSQHGVRSFIEAGFSFVSWGATGGPGWFHNSGEFAIQMCVYLPMVLHLVLSQWSYWPVWKRWTLAAVLPGFAAVSLVASSSRGGQLGGVFVLGIMLAQTRRFRMIVLGGMLLVVTWFLVPDEQRARFESMGSDDTSVSRLTYWKNGLEIIQQNPLTGIGYESWLPYYRATYDIKGQLSHNIFIQAASELGYPGFIAFLLLIGGTLTTNYKTRRLAKDTGEWEEYIRGSALGLDAALGGFLLSGFFVTVLYYPYFWMNLTFTSSLYLMANRLAKNRRRNGRAAPPQMQAGVVPGAVPAHPAPAGVARMTARRPDGLTPGPALQKPPV